MADTFPVQSTKDLNRQHSLSGFFFSSEDDSYDRMNFVSAGFYALTGFQIADITNEGVLNLKIIILPADYKKNSSTRKKALEAKGHWEGQYHVLHKDGTQILIHEYADKIVGADGKSFHIEGHIEIVADTKTATIFPEKNSLFESLGHAIMMCTTDLKGVITYVNNAFCKETGYRPNELVGKTFETLNSDFHTKAFFNDLWATIKSGEVWRGELRNQSENGEFNWYATTISPVKNDTGAVIGYLSVYNNITDKKIAEGKLDKARKRLRFINEHSPDLLVTTDLDLHITYVNHSRSGFQHEISVGTALMQYIAPDFRERFLNYLAQAIAGTPQEFEMPGYANDFHLVWYSVRIALIGKYDKLDSLLIVSSNITDNKLAEEKTLQSEKRFRTLFERNLAGVYRASLDDVILECNNAFARMIGYRSAADVVGKSAPDLYTNISDKKFVEKVRNNSGRLSSHESCIELKNGKKVYLLENASLILHANGEADFIEGTMIDITERKESEKELLRNKEHYRMLLHNMNDGFLVDDANGRITFANRRCSEMFGYDFAEFMSLSIEDLFAPQYHKEMRDRHNRRIAGEVVTDNMEYSGVRKDGSLIWLEVHVNLVVEDGIVVGTQSVLQDITGKKQQEAEFRRLANLNHNIIDSSDELFYVIEVDPEDSASHRMMYLSGKSWEFSGFSSEQVLAHPGLWFSRLHPDDVPEVRDFTARIYSSSTPLSCVYRINHIVTGEFVWLYDFVKPIFNAEGKLVELYGSIKNITELKHREAELEKTSRDLSNRYNELMQFNYIVSHNLRSPVANILGMVEILHMPDMTVEDKETCIEHIETAVHRMDYVIKDLNSILETRSALNEKKELVTLHSLLENLTATLDKQISESGTDIRIQVSKEANTLFTIRGYLESILYNLLSNAIKYKSADRQPFIEIAARIHREQVWITVTDNGMGIDLKKFGKQVFGLYKRFNTEVEGKGLGLYMTRTQVETLGGKISVISSLGNGATFTVQLPLA